LIASATREEEKLSLDVANLEFQIKKVKEKVRKKRKKNSENEKIQKSIVQSVPEGKVEEKNVAKEKPNLVVIAAEGVKKKGKNGKFFHKFSFAYIIRLYELIGDNFSEIRKYSVIISKKRKKSACFGFFPELKPVALNIGNRDNTSRSCFGR